MHSQATHGWFYAANTQRSTPNVQRSITEKKKQAVAPDSQLPIREISEICG
jgi:hypothetical protein